MAAKKNVSQVKLWLWYLRKHANVDVDDFMNFTHLSTGPDHTKSLCLKRKSINVLEDIYITRIKWILAQNEIIATRKTSSVRKASAFPAREEIADI